MNPTGITGTLARNAARRPWLVVASWAVVLVLGLATMLTLGDRFSAEEEIRADLEARTADTLIGQRLNGGVEDPAQEFVIVSSSDLTVDNPAFQAVVAALAAEIAAHSDLVASVETYYDSGQEELVSFDRQRTIIVATFAGDPQDAIHDALPVIDLIRARQIPAPGFEVLTLGAVSVTDTFNTIAEADIARGESIGILVALVVMAVVFGTLVAAGLPIVLTIVALLVTMSIAMAVSHVANLHMGVVQMIFMIGLAVGIDYALFIVSRVREEREHGLNTLDAITRAGETSSKAVLFSGLTVIVSLLSLLLVRWNLLTSIAAGAILVVAVSVLMTLTLLPAILSLLGDRINRGKVPFIGYQRAAAGTEATAHGFWNWTSAAVMRRPLVSLVASAGLLLVLTSFAFQLNFGHETLNILPEDSSSMRAFSTFEREFPGADYQPVTIVVAADDVTTPATQQAITGLLGQLASDPFFGAATQVTAEGADLVRIDVALNGDGESEQAIDAVQRLRGEYIPAHFAATDAEVYVTGDTALMVDTTSMVRSALPIVFAFVLTISFLLLLVAFRSIVVPLKAIAMNLLSVGASYGLLVLVFQKGIGADLLGFRQVERIDAFIPLMLFTILFGLSMDYHVFLLSRIKEQFDLTGDNEQSVASGLRSTGRLISGAALIMVGVFGGFALTDLSAMQQFGFGLAVAVVLDATIVRMVLVPASMALLGERNWYLPAKLAWLPHIHIDGAPARGTAASRDAGERSPEGALAD
ncbi:MAG: MMPL family transporter [Chloroflexi bacterium]|nr:MAG: MMPL family transporter [Chloroflexota bacterium]